MTIEGLRLKSLKIQRKLFSKYKNKKITNSNFTIISNNCWGGMVYESYNLPKQSPTVGCFFMAADYIKFLTDLNGYLNAELTFIEPKETRWINAEEVSKDSRFGSYPIGVLDNGVSNIEIFFLHCHTETEAREKWVRRCKRINYERMLVKFNDQNGCTYKDIKEFLQLPYKNKIFFTSRKWDEINSDEVIVIPQNSRENHIQTSYEPFWKNKYIDIDNLINTL